MFINHKANGAGGGLGVGVHRAELDQREGAAVEAHALLAIKDGPVVFEPDEGSDEG